MSEENVTDDEFPAIAAMLKEAHKYGLDVEVVWSFANELRGSDCSYAQAANNALLEWDI